MTASSLFYQLLEKAFKEFPMLLKSLTWFPRVVKHGTEEKLGKARGVERNIRSEEFAIVGRVRLHWQTKRPPGKAVLFQNFFFFTFC